MASPQNDGGRLDWNKRHLAISTRVRFFRSATPFCSEIYVTVSLHLIPFFFRKSSNSWFTYSLPLSNCKHLIFPVWFFANALKSLNAPNISLLFLSILTTHHREQLSINVARYLDFLIDSTLMGLNTSEWIKSKSFLFVCPTSLETESLSFYREHKLHIWGHARNLRSSFRARFHREHSPKDLWDWDDLFYSVKFHRCFNESSLRSRTCLRICFLVDSTIRLHE